MKILVAGGAGFIGSNFIRHILKEYPDYSVINLDKLSYCGNLANLEDIEKNSRYKFVKGDICDAKVVEKLIKDCDAIINFAGQTHVDRSIVDAQEFIRTNVFGIHILLEAASKFKVGLFCQISTDEVYGSREEGYFKEDDAFSPSSPYSASKAAADHLIHSYQVTYNLPTMIIRSTNNFGPYQHPEKLVPLFITNALEGKKLPVYGDGKNVRDWIYVLDSCQAVDFIVHHGKSGEIYNIAGNNQIKNIELTRLILKNMRKDENLIKFVKDRPGHDRRYAIDCTKVNALGWKPSHNFEQAIKETIEWYSNNREWWQPLKKL